MKQVVNPLLVLGAGVCLLVAGIIVDVIAFRIYKDWLMFISTVVGICGGIGLILASIGYLITGG